MKSMQKQTIAITMGDPAGIGPEVIFKALADDDISRLANWIVVGDASIMRQTAEACRIDTAQLSFSLLDTNVFGAEERIAPGKLSAAAGTAAVEYVRIATELCLQGNAAAMVTAPLNKEAVTMSGRRFSGHTEYIAELCGARESRMLLTGPRLNVVHVSTHIALRSACNLETGRILRTIELGNDAMRLLGHTRPRIVVCGLNPHAGEHGLFGNEDADIILPAIQQANTKGIFCDGPAAPDTVFLQASRGKYDLLLV